MTKCPVCGMMVDENTAPSSVFEGREYYFMNPIHKEMFDKEPERFLGRQTDQEEHPHQA